MGINERFKEMRLACDFTQTEFAEILQMKRNSIASIESGERTVSDRHLALLQAYAEKNTVSGKVLNIEWLKTGEGDMFIPLSRNEQILSFANEIIESDDSDFKKRFVEALTKLNSDDWKALERIADKMLKNKKE